MSRSFQKLLESQWDQKKFVCVGLDPVFEKLPQKIHSTYDNVADQFFIFNRKIIDATADIACAYKPNIAFYEAKDEEGMKALRATLEYLEKEHPEIPVILDAKRADIGKTNLGYVSAYFDEMGVDALTVNPYLGKEALDPFLERSDKGIIILVRTSNEGADRTQDIVVEASDGSRMPYYEYIAHQVIDVWNYNNNCSVVAGATNPEQLGNIRAIIGDIPMLIPGIGTQGGDVEKAVKNGLNSKGAGIIINSSSGILYASSGDDFAEAAHAAAESLHNEILNYI